MCIRTSCKLSYQPRRISSCIIQLSEILSSSPISLFYAACSQIGAPDSVVVVVQPLDLLVVTF
jgi:hypothetical protein